MFPKAPSSAVDWSKIGLQGFDQASHVESSWSVETCKWSAPKIVQDPWIRVHGLSPGLNYGQQCYEGLKACRTADGRILLFRPGPHATRMIHSTQVVSIPTIPEDHFMACVQSVVAANSEFVPPHDSNALLYIRPVAFGSSAQLALTSPREFTFAVYIQPGSAYHGVGAQDALVLEDFDRTAPRGVGSAKVGGNYAPVMRWSDQARREGFGITLHLDSATRTEVDEFSTSGFIGVREHNGHFTLVVPNSPSILESITTDTCVETAKSLGWKVEKRAVKWDELAFLSEVLAVGTATLLLPIGSITRRSTGEKLVYRDGDKTAGPACATLRAAIDDVMRGKSAAPDGWCVPVVDYGAELAEQIITNPLLPVGAPSAALSGSPSKAESELPAAKERTTTVFGSGNTHEAIEELCDQEQKMQPVESVDHTTYENISDTKAQGVVAVVEEIAVEG